MEGKGEKERKACVCEHKIRDSIDSRLFLFSLSEVVVRRSGRSVPTEDVPWWCMVEVEVCS